MGATLPNPQRPTPDAFIPADCFCGLQRPATLEDGKLGEEPLKLRREKLIAPVERGSQAAVARHSAPLPGYQQIEPLLQPGKHLRGGHDPGARSGQLEGQRQPLQPPAQRRHRCRVRVRYLEIGPGSLGSIHEEPHAGAGEEG